MTKALARTLLWAAPALGRVVRTLPGGLGAGAVSYGAYEIYPPAGIIVAGLFLLALDRTV